MRMRRWTAWTWVGLFGWSPVGAAALQEPEDALSWPISGEAWNTPYTIERVAEGLTVPSQIVFLPDGRALVAERPVARLGILDATTGAHAPVATVAPRFEEIGAGLQDVALDPHFARDPWIYFSYTDTADGGTTLVLDRARLVGDDLVDRERLFVARPGYATDDHYGGRIVLGADHLFLTVGDRQTRDSAQVLTTHTGKIVRLHHDGRVPADNPFVGLPGALPEIWSSGHRNPQGLVRDGRTGRLWSHEHGPRGGDELNVIEAGANYGWPVVTYGGEYEGGPVGEGLVTHPGMVQPVWLYRPSIAPSGVELYRGDAFPEWRGALLVGAMAGRHLSILRLDGERVIHEERVLEGRGWRVRAVREGPDGFVYLGVDDGMILRLRPRA